MGKGHECENSVSKVDQIQDPMGEVQRRVGLSLPGMFIGEPKADIYLFPEIEHQAFSFSMVFRQHGAVATRLPLTKSEASD